MADQIETSKLGLDASQLLSTLAKVAKQYGLFTEALLENTDAVDVFNVSQESLEKAIKAGSDILGSAIGKLEAYAEAEEKAAKAAELVAEAERSAAAARRRSVADSVSKGFNSPNAGIATPQEVSKFDKAIASLKGLISQSDISEERIRQINADLAANYEGTEREIRDSLLRVEQATERLGASAAKGIDKAISEVTEAKRRLAGTNIAKDIGDALNFNRTNSGSKAVQDFDRVADQLGKLASEEGVTVDRIKQINNDLAASYTGTERQIRDTLSRLATIVQQANQKIAASSAATAGASAASNFTNRLRSNAAGGTTGAESAAFDKVAADLAKVAAKYGTTEQRIEEINRDLVASYTGADREIRDVLVKLESAFSKLGSSAAKELNSSTANAAKVSKQSIDSARSSLDLFNTGLVRTGDLARGLIIYRAFNLAEDAITSAISRARELDTVLAQIQTIADSGILPGDLGRGQLREFTANVASEFGIDQVEVARATYEAFSNQLGSTSETLQFVRDSAVLAKGGVASLDDSVNLLTAGIHGLGTSTSDTSHLVDVMFKTVDLGVVKIDELARSLGPIFPLAGQLGIRAEEAAAGLTTLSRQGFTTDEAITRLSRGMTALIKPSKAMQQAMREIGVESAAAGIQAFGFIGFIEKLVATTDGSIESVSTLFDEIREGQFAFVELRDGAKQYNKDLAELDSRNKTVGIGAKALNTILESQSQQLAKNAEAFKTELASAIGDRVLVLLNELVEGFGGAEQAATRFADVAELALKVSVAAALGFGASQAVRLVGALQLAAVEMRALGAASLFASGPLGLIVSAGTLAGFLAIEALLTEDRKAADDFAESMRKVDTELDSKLKSLAATQRTDKLDFGNSIKSLTGNTAKGLAELQSLYNQAADEAIATQKKVNANIERQLDERVKLTESVLKRVVDAEVNAADEIDKIQRKIADRQLDRSLDRFDRDIQRRFNGDEEGKNAALLAKVAQLTAQAEAAKGQDPKKAEALAQAAEKYAEEVARSEKGWQAGEQAITRIGKLLDDIDGKAIDRQVELENAAKNTREALEGSVTALREMVAEQEKLNKLILEAKSGGDDKAIPELEGRLKQLTTKIEEGFRDFKIDDVFLKDNDIESLVKRIHEPFRSAFTNDPIGLTFAVEEGFSKVKATLLQRFADLQIPVNLDLGSGGTKELGFGGLKDLQNRQVELERQVNAGKDAEQSLETQNVKTGASYQKLAQGVQAASTQLGEVTDKIAKTQAVQLGLETIFGSDKTLKQLQQNVETRKAIAAELENLKTQAGEAFNEGDATQLAKVQERLGAIRQEFENAEKAQSGFGFKATAEIVGAMEAQVANLSTMVEEAQQLRQTVEAGAKAGTELIDVNAAIQATGVLEQLDNVAANTANSENAMGQAADSAAQGLQVQADSAINSANASEAAAQGALNAAQAFSQMEQRARAAAAAAAQAAAAGAGSGQAVGKALGGFMPYLAGGGFVPKGSDVIPAMLGAGEFVMPAAQSRQFAAELASMRAGRRPQYLNNGGPVTENFNFGGDIIVNQQRGEDGVALANSLKRVARRRAVSIGR